MVDAKTNDGKITSIADLLSLVGNSKFNDMKRAHVRLWFRGQSNASWNLIPFVYRPEFPAKNEKERLELECQLTQDFRVQSAGLLEGAKNDAEMYFLQQHYQMPTRLLDWTHSPLAALYFAVANTSEKDSDGALFMIDAYRLAPCQHVEEFFRGVPTSRHLEFQKALRPIIRWQIEPGTFPHFILPVRPDHFDKRVALQRGCFTFHVPEHNALTKSECDSLRAFFIPRSSKEQLTKDLFALGIDAFSIYGDLESLSRRLKYAHAIEL